jgi:hypothetical protein
MIARAEAIEAERKERSGYNNQKFQESEKNGHKDAKFMKRMQTDAYMGSEMNLEDRLNRNRHYRARDVLR